MANNISTNPFELYGIKEVADVMLLDTSGMPVMVFDTLKMSGIEETAEETSAFGGKGSAKLITWDYKKDITFTMQDALISTAGMKLLMGGAKVTTAAAKRIMKTERVIITAAGTDATDDMTVSFVTSFTPVAGSIKILDLGVGGAYAAPVFTISDFNVADATALGVSVALGETLTVVYAIEVAAAGIYEIAITPEIFPGIYQMVGDTVIRNRRTGLDEGFQFIVPKVKLAASVNLNFEAEGDPAVIDMTMTALKANNGTMMSLVKYTVPDEAAEAQASNLAPIS